MHSSLTHYMPATTDPVNYLASMIHNVVKTTNSARICALWYPGHNGNIMNKVALNQRIPAIVRISGIFFLGECKKTCFRASQSNCTYSPHHLMYDKPSIQRAVPCENWYIVFNNCDSYRVRDINDHIFFVWSKYSSVRG